MDNDTQKPWLVPAWRAPDRELIDGRIPASLADCVDLAGARLYLAFKARSRVQNFLLGRKPTTARGVAHYVLSLNRELNALSLGRLGPALPTYKTLDYLHRVLSERLTGGASSAPPTKTLLTVASADRPVRGNADWWPSIRSLGDEVHSEGGMVLLQGSQADGRTTGFSDIDLWMVGDFKNRELKRLKDELDKAVLVGDPLQHRGVFWVDRRDLTCYWSMQLPTEALRLAGALHDPVELAVVEFEEPYGAAAHLIATLKKWTSVVDNGLTPTGMWQWKFWLSELMLVPTLLQASGGRNLYKGQSFSLSRSMYSDSAWRAIDMATTVRSGWPPPKRVESYLRQPSRRFGVLATDAWPVEKSVDVLSDKAFVVSARALVAETRDLVGL